MNKVKLTDVTVYMGLDDGTWKKKTVTIPAATSKEEAFKVASKFIKTHYTAQFICPCESILDFFIDNTNGRLNNIVNFSLTHPKKATLTYCFERLKEMCEQRKNTIIILFYDWAPMSLGWSIINSKTGFLDLSGGLIYHGSISGEHASNGSVIVNPVDGWQIHT